MGAALEEVSDYVKFTLNKLFVNEKQIMKVVYVKEFKYHVFRSPIRSQWW